TLVREAKKSQDWLTKVQSFHVKLEQETVSYERPTTAPTADATPKPTTRRAGGIQEMAFDQTRLYQSSLSPISPSLASVRFWDGHISGYQGRENFYELTDSIDVMARSFMTNGTWGRNGQAYWWTRNTDRRDDFIGAPEQYRLGGREALHGVDCYVLEGGQFN